MSDTRTLPLEEARRNLDALVSEATSGSVVVIEQDGAPVVAILPGEEYANYRRMVGKRERLFAVLDAGQAAFADVPPEEVEREIARALKKIRRDFTSQSQ